MYSLTTFAANFAMDYGLYIDSSPVSIGESNTVHYIQNTSSSYAMSSNGYALGVTTMTGLTPITIPLYIPPSATNLVLSVANSSVAMSPITSIAPGYNSIVTTSSGTSNTSGYIPQNTFTTAGSFTYTIPSVCSAGTVTGVYFYIWGTGGQGANTGNLAPGGGGGYTSGFFAGVAGGTITCVIGTLGGATIATGGGGTGGGGLGGGGFGGIFDGGTLTTTSVIAVAGGGGSAYVNGDPITGGGGGGSNGGIPYDTGTSAPWTQTTAATQSAAGVNSTGPGYPNAAGTSAQQWIGGGTYSSGGGGWFGGAGAYDKAGGGGSGYLSSTKAVGGVMSNGQTATSLAATTAQYSNVLPGNTTSPFYISGKACGNGSTGIIALVPAVGTNPVYVGVTAKMLVT